MDFHTVNFSGWLEKRLLDIENFGSIIFVDFSGDSF